MFFNQLFSCFSVYQDRPPVPPSNAKLGAQISVCQRTYRQSITALFMNKGFVLLVITYGELNLKIVHIRYVFFVSRRSKLHGYHISVNDNHEIFMWSIKP